MQKAASRAHQRLLRRRTALPESGLGIPIAPRLSYAATAFVLLRGRRCGFGL